MKELFVIKENSQCLEIIHRNVLLKERIEWSSSKLEKEKEKNMMQLQRSREKKTRKNGAVPKEHEKVTESTANLPQ